MGCISPNGRKLSPTPSEFVVSGNESRVEGEDDTGQGLMKRAIGVTRLKDQKPGMKWAGLFGSGGDDLKYGFEPEVRRPPCVHGEGDSSTNE